MKLSGEYYETLLTLGFSLDEVLAVASANLDLNGEPPPASDEAPTQRCPACCPTVPSAPGVVTVREQTIPVTEAA